MKQTRLVDEAEEVHYSARILIFSHANLRSLLNSLPSLGVLQPMLVVIATMYLSIWAYTLGVMNPISPMEATRMNWQLAGQYHLQIVTATLYLRPALSGNGKAQAT